MSATPRMTPARARLLRDAHMGAVEWQAGQWWHLPTGWRVTNRVEGLIRLGLVVTRTGRAPGRLVLALTTDGVRALERAS